MSAKQIVMAAAGATAEKTYVDDVFSTYLYTGNGSTQTITNGIDLSGKGGMVWIKRRDASAIHNLWDTARGATKYLQPAGTAAEATAASGVSSFGSVGFTLQGFTDANTSGANFASWTFRKAPKFFDVVTYTGTGSSLTVSHSLGAPAGILFIKRIDASGGWVTQHISTTTSVYFLNTTAANANGNAYFAGTAMSSTNFTVGGLEPEVNANGASYVAYLFAHDTSASGLIQCGSYTGNGSATGPTITLGWEPQWLMIKRATGGTGNWNIFDNVRGMTVGGNDWYLEANTVDAEAGADWITPTSTGFQIVSTSTEVNNNTNTYVYVAIRRSNKPPTSGSQVFSAGTYTGDATDNRFINTTILADAIFVRARLSNANPGMLVGSRLQGQNWMRTGATNAETSGSNQLDQQLVGSSEIGTAFSSQNGFFVGGSAVSYINPTPIGNVFHAFRRASGFFDVVCYTGNGSTQSISHGLGATPGLVIIKRRDAASSFGWFVIWQPGAGNDLLLNSNGTGGYNALSAWSSSSFSPGVGSADVNGSGGTYIAYLFATLPGISKVGTYTGNGGTVSTNGTSQTINCGFSAGARFVLIKRADSAGDWYIWDTARGIVAANDPYLRLNSTAAEVTTNDSVDPDNSGFIVNQVAATNINVTGATYLYLAIA